MADQTILNPELDGLSATEVNQTVIDEYNRENGITAAEIPEVKEGAVLEGGYEIVRKLEVTSGEADLYLCTKDEERFAAKIYQRRTAMKPEVTAARMEIDSPYVAKLYAAGEYEGCPFEILPYYEKGSLSGRMISFEDLCERIIPQLNEGLKAVHEAGIIHKDLKPSNIMCCDDGKTVSIIDFGISSAMENQQTVLVTRTGMTPEYAAPETFRNVYCEESDYYSLGVTLFELFCGYTPYSDLDPADISRYLSIQRIPLPSDMPERLGDLILGLTYSDISRRHEKDNPNRRWVYDDVVRWLKKEPYVLPGEGRGMEEEEEIPPFELAGETYTTLSALTDGLADHWEEGKIKFFRGELTAYFRSFRRETARKCSAAEEEAEKLSGHDDLVYRSVLYRINPSLHSFCWQGRRFESLPAFGRQMLEKLWDQDHSDDAFLREILKEHVLSAYVSDVSGDNGRLMKAAEALEAAYDLEEAEGTDGRRAFWLSAFTLSGQKLLMADGEQFRTPGELAGYMRKLLNSSYKRFASFCHQLADADGTPDPQLEAWLMVLGRQEELKKWRESLD